MYYLAEFLANSQHSVYGNGCVNTNMAVAVATAVFGTGWWEECHNRYILFSSALSRFAKDWWISKI